MARTNKTLYAVRLEIGKDGDGFTAYYGFSMQRALEVLDVVRNTLIRSHATGTVVLRDENAHVVRFQAVKDGAWTPVITTAE